MKHPVVNNRKNPILDCFVFRILLLRRNYWANGPKATQAGTGCTELQLIGSCAADCQALT